MRALFFDFDGIIVDTEPVHMEAWLDVLEPWGISFDETAYRAHYLGLNDREFLEAVLSTHQVNLTASEKNDLINAKLAQSLSLLQHDIPVFPGVLDFISRVEGKAKLGIVSGARRAEIDFVLSELHVKEFFHPIISAEDVARGKPDPQGYQLAFEKMNSLHSWKPKLSPHECLVIEDSPKGIIAAKKAGLRCLAITNSYGVKELQGADAIAPSLAEIEPFPIFS